MRDPNPNAPRCFPSGHACGGHEKYNMDCAEYAALRSRADGRCEMCGTPEDQTTCGRLIIDHAHDYGESAVRGLLCSSCNSRMRDADYATPTKRSHDKEVAAYLGNAWFMQVIRWARSADGLLGHPDLEGQRLIDAALRQAAVRRLVQVLGVQPKVESYVDIAQGSAGLHIRATFICPSGPTVTVDLAHRAGKAFVNNYIQVAFSAGYAERFASVTDALLHMRLKWPAPAAA